MWYDFHPWRIGEARQGDLHNYRVLLNLQHLHFRGFSVEPIDGWVPGFISTETDPSSFFLQKFMYPGSPTAASFCRGWDGVGALSILDRRKMILS